jgi:hypothetical protein
MRVPTELVMISSTDDSFPAEFHWRIATERCMYTMTVIEIPELSKFSVQVTGIPKEYVIYQTPEFSFGPVPFFVSGQ